MRFDAWKAEIHHARSSFDRLDEAGRRQWDLHGIMVEISVSTDPDSNPRVRLAISVWKPQENSSTTLANGKRFEGGYWDLEYRGVETLTSKQLHTIARMREVVERWVAGKIDELPIFTPPLAE